MGVQVAPLPDPIVRHTTLKTTFTGVLSSLSAPNTPVLQFRGIKYASIPARFRQSRLFTAYHSHTDATRHGPICPQPRGAPIEETLFGFSKDECQPQNLKQSEFECLNMNITCPAGLTRQSRIPVMIWIHGGGNCGSGSHWLYDGGALVQSSVQLGKPIILVTINYRLGFLGFAASPKLLEDNSHAGDFGVGNYGLLDQRRALEWVHHFIADFGGDPSNITLIGQDTGAFDILCHLTSHANASHPLFHRAIIQSPLIDTIPDVSSAGSHVFRAMSALHLSTVEDLRRVDVDKLLSLNFCGHAVNDGTFFIDGWKDLLFPEVHSHHQHRVHEPFEALSRHLAHSHSRVPQSIMIGDCACESSAFEHSASLWTPSGAVRRLKAICGSLSRAAPLLRAYDIDTHTHPDELPERVLELVNDARVAWPVDCITETFRSAGAGHGSKVWRYVFDQETPKRGIPHHGADVLFLFDTAPPADDTPSFDAFDSFGSYDTFESFSDDDESDDGDVFPADSVSSASSDPYCFGGQWTLPPVSFCTYTNIRTTLQARWLTFAYGQAPWSSSENAVFVFGPEGETGERSLEVFEGRRRRAVWRTALASLGLDMVRKIGVELGNGPVSNQCMARI